MVSSESGAEKVGHLHVNQHLHIMHKNKLKIT